MRALAGFAIVVAIGGCAGDGGGGARVTLVDQPAGTNRSGADLSGYDQVGTLDSWGGQVALPDGTRVVAGSGGIGEAVSLGLRSADRAPAGDHSGVAVSAWVEAEADLLDAQAAIESPFLIEVPVTPPPGTEDHPGLQLTMVLPGAQSFPVDGAYDPFSGVFRAALPALPPRFTFAVTYDATMTRLDGADVPDETWGASLSAPLGDGTGWSTIEFVIDFNQQKVTLAQARKVARAAREAARLYSAVGFKEPFLFKNTTVLGERWHIHLTDKGSSFDSNHSPTAADEAGRFGRLYVGTGRIDAPATDSLGSVLASIAHEMFHAIFFSYRIPSRCFNYQDGGQTWCYRSYNGFNEGAATAIGYAIDQKEPKPRPSESPFVLFAPLGYFDAGSRSMAYRNQDFFVFLLRIGTLQHIERLLSALTHASMPAADASSYSLLEAYAVALEAGGLGFDVGFTELVGGYTANRGFLREYEGHIWPDEPAGAPKGAQFVLDASLFGSFHYTMDPRDCEEDPDAGIVECTADLEQMAPMSGGVFTIDIESLAEDWEIEPDRVAVSVTTTSGKVAYWVFGENDGVGADGGYASAMDGAEAVLPGGAIEWSVARVLVAQGAGVGTVTLRVVFGQAARGGVFVGTGTLTETLQASGGNPGVCTQAVSLTLEVDRLPGWVELNFEAIDAQFHIDVDDNTTCVLGSDVSRRTLWTSEHPAGQFSLSHSGLTSPWLHGTYSRDSATGFGVYEEGGFRQELTFSLVASQP